MFSELTSFSENMKHLGIVFLLTIAENFVEGQRVSASDGTQTNTTKLKISVSIFCCKNFS